MTTRNVSLSPALGRRGRNSLRVHGRWVAFQFVMILGWAHGSRAAAPLPSASTSPPASATELLVKWQGGPDGDSASLGNAFVGAEVRRNFREIGWQQVTLPMGMTTLEGLEAYRGLGTVLAVEPNRAVESFLPEPARIAPEPVSTTVEAVATADTGPTQRKAPRLHSPATDTVPNDPMFSSQWNLKKIGATDAWTVTTGSPDVVVALIDSGANYLHPDLAANMWRNPGETGLDANGHDKATNGVDDDGDGYVDDVHGADVKAGTGDPMDPGFTRPSTGTTSPRYHGTSCAGIIGAAGDNGLGLAGINWRVKIMALAFTYGNLDQASLVGTVADNIAAFDYVLAMKRRGVNVRVINNSYSDPIFSLARTDAIAAAGALDILCVFASGNSGVNLDTSQWLVDTTDLPNVVTVAGTDKSDLLVGNFNYGRTTVDLAAPCLSIATPSTGTGYISDFGGTSAAAPHLSGAAALLCAAKPGITVDEMKAALFGSVDPLPSLRNTVRTGGRLNAGRAVQSLMDPDPVAIVINAAPGSLRSSFTEPIEITFSQPMDRASVESAFQLTPSIPGTAAWSADNRVFTFRHEEPFQRTNYTARLLGSAVDAHGRTLDGDFNRVSEGAPLDDFVWTFGFPVSNDDFADAQEIGGVEGSVKADSRTATLEFGEPQHAGVLLGANASVWYRWTAPRSGAFTFDLTQATSFNSLLGVYRGAGLAGLTEVAANSNYGTKAASRVTFLADGFQTYSIAVAGDATGGDVAGSMGKFTLRWYPTPPLGFTDSSFTPRSGVYGTQIRITGTNLTLVTEVRFKGTDGHQDVWAPFTVSKNPDSRDLELLVTVPTLAVTGPILLHASELSEVASAVSFDVLPPTLGIRWAANGSAVITWPPPVVPDAVLPHVLLESSDGLAPESWDRALPEPDHWSGLMIVSPGAQPGQRLYRLRIQ